MQQLMWKLNEQTKYNFNIIQWKTNTKSEVFWQNAKFVSL